jgi:hypothetical protein
LSVEQADRLIAEPSRSAETASGLIFIVDFPC